LPLIKNETVACLVFDQAVNRGTRAAITSLQNVLNKWFWTSLKVDGVLGPKVAEATNAANPWPLALAYIRDAQEHYLNIAIRNPSQMVFLKGWMARTWRLFDLIA